RHGPRLLLPPFAVLADQVEQHALDVVAEAAAPRVGALQAAPHQGEAELLHQVVGRLRTDGTHQVAPYRAAVAFHQALLRGSRRPAGPAVRLVEDRPGRRDAAQASMEILALHTRLPALPARGAGPGNPLWPPPASGAAIIPDRDSRMPIAWLEWVRFRD